MTNKESYGICKSSTPDIRAQRRAIPLRNGSPDPDNNCGGGCGKKPASMKIAKPMASFIALCAVCCAIVPVLAAAGLIGTVTGVYISKGIEAFLISVGLIGFGYIVMRFVRKRRRGLAL